MSTRRPLGTGPSTPPSVPAATDPAPRLLPVERAEPGAGRDLIEHQDVPADPARRPLGKRHSRQ